MSQRRKSVVIRGEQRNIWFQRCPHFGPHEFNIALLHLEFLIVYSGSRRPWIVVVLRAGLGTPGLVHRCGSVAHWHFSAREMQDRWLNALIGRVLLDRLCEGGVFAHAISLLLASAGLGTCHASNDSAVLRRCHMNAYR
jgi:hypothetical protein